MTFTPEILLSDQFAEFSGKVTALHEKKKELITEFRKVYEAHKAEIKAIDDQSTELQGLFNEWAAQVSSKAPKKVAKPETEGKLDGHNV